MEHQIRIVGWDQRVPFGGHRDGGEDGDGLAGIVDLPDHSADPPQVVGVKRHPILCDRALYVLDNLPTELVAPMRPGSVHSSSKDSGELALRDGSVVDPGLSHRVSHTHNPSRRVAPGQFVLILAHSSRLLGTADGCHSDPALPRPIAAPQTRLSFVSSFASLALR